MLFHKKIFQHSPLGALTKGTFLFLLKIGNFLTCSLWESAPLSSFWRLLSDAFVDSGEVLLLAALGDLSAMLFLLMTGRSPSLLLRLLLGDAFPNKEPLGGALLLHKWIIARLVCSTSAPLSSSLRPLGDAFPIEGRRHSFSVTPSPSSSRRCFS